MWWCRTFRAGFRPSTGVMDVWGSKWLSFFCPWVPGFSFPRAGGVLKVDCGCPPALSLPPLPENVGWHGSSQTLALSASSPSACLSRGPKVGLGVMRSGLCHSFRVPHLFCRQMSLRQCSCFLALTAKVHAGPTETHTAEMQPNWKLASLEVPLRDWKED